MSGGPFKIGSLDKTAKTITVVHNDKWWGKAPKLDKIQFIVLDQAAQAKALQSDQVDFVDIGSSVATYATVKATPGVSIHKAGGPNWRHIDIGRSGPLADVKVRQAIELAIDRTGDAKTMLSPLDWPATVLDSHIWMNNQGQYKRPAVTSASGTSPRRAACSSRPASPRAPTASTPRAASRSA